MAAQDPKEIIKLLDGIPLFRRLNEKEKKSLADLKAVVVRHNTEELIGLLVRRLDVMNMNILPFLRYH